MDDFSLNHYLKLIGLTLLIGLMIYVVELVVFSALGLTVPQFFLIVVALLGSGLLVYKFFAVRIY